MKGAGGTSGGIASFFIGLAMAVGGGYMITSRVMISSHGFMGMLFGGSRFGLTLLPFLIGVVFLFFDADNWFGWILSGLGLLIIFLGIIMSLRMNFRPTTLYEVILMFVLLFGGVGLILRSFKSS